MKKFMNILFSLLLVLSLGIGVSAETFQEGETVYTYEITGENTARLLSVTGINPKTGFEIPRELDGYTVNAIGYGFLDEELTLNDELASLSVPNTVTQIDPGFLFGVKLSSLQAGADQMLLHLEDGNSVYTYCFKDGVGCLVETDTGRMVSVPEKRNKTLAIPSQVKILGASALAGQSIHTLYLPASLEKIEPGALDAAEKIEWLELEDGAAFVIQGKKLLDAEGTVIFPEEKETDPTESYTTSDGLTVTPTTQEQKLELQEKERKNRWINGLGYGVAALLIFAVVLVIVQTIRGEGPMCLASLFEQPPLFFFDMVLCIGILLLPQMLEEETFWLTGNKLAVALTVIAVAMGTVGVVVEIFHAGIIWAIPRLLVKAIFIVVLAAISLTESIFAFVAVIMVLWRVVANAVRGAWTIICGLGLAPVFEIAGYVATEMANEMPDMLWPAYELEAGAYTDATGTKRVFIGPDGGFVHLKEVPYSSIAEVRYNGKTLTANRGPNGEWIVNGRLSDAPPVPNTPPQKDRVKLTFRQRIQFILIGGGRLILSLPIMVQFIESMF